MTTVIDTAQTNLTEYLNLFVQPQPWYIVKRNPAGWRRVKHTMPATMVAEHLEGEGRIALGSVAKWYPQHALLDFDDMAHADVERIRAEMHFTPNNSTLEHSESVDSYHLLFRPTYREAAPTVRLLQQAMRPVAKRHAIEIYPQGRKAVRLPFGALQSAADPDKYGFDWQARMYWFEKLDDYDLLGAPRMQQELPLDRPKPKVESIFREGQALLHEGLVISRSRHEAQWKVLYTFWRRNLTPELAEQATWEWIRRKHNGHSKDILTNPRQVRREIHRQTNWLWSHFEHLDILPDDAHNTYNGWITPDDIVRCLHLVDGSLPRAKLLIEIVKYSNPRRRRRGGVSIHSDKLIGWASTGYVRYLDDFQSNRILTRGNDYVRDLYAKRIRLTRWPWSTVDQAVLVDNRTPETLSELLKAAWPDPREARAVLLRTGMNERALRRFYAGQPEAGEKVNYMSSVLSAFAATG